MKKTLDIPVEDRWTVDANYGFKDVACPKCKVEHTAYIHSHKSYNDLRCDDCYGDLTIGQRVKYHREDGTITEHTILHIDNDLCGDGCCEGYKLSDTEGYTWKTSVEGIYGR